MISLVHSGARNSRERNAFNPKRKKRMRTNGPNSGVARLGMGSVRGGLRSRIQAVLVAAAVIFFASAAVEQISAQEHKRTTTAKKSSAAPQPASVAPEPVPPKLPDWPANNQPTNATVAWNSKGLRVDAANSSLQQIMKDVATATGATISGLNADQRMFGTYGPGPARDVISQLLEGSGYNVLMIGDQGGGTPRQVVLSRQPTGPAPAATNNQASGADDSGAEAEEPPPPAQMPSPQQQPQQNAPGNNGFGPGAQPRTPQQILQEMQQRQQQIEQMQQQQQQQRNNPQ
jgi:hypothetical protein